MTDISLFGALLELGIGIGTENPEFLQQGDEEATMLLEEGVGARVLTRDLACSFTSATMVGTDHGKQAIGTLHSGEKVLAYNGQTHKMEMQPILHVWVHQDDDLVDLTITTPALSSPGKDTQASRRISEVVHTNQKHPFLTIEKGFLPVGQIKVGMHVLRADGRIGMISAWKVIPGTQAMYNLEVDQDHTFTVGTGEWIVHNCAAGPLDNKILRAFDSADVGPHTAGEMGLIARMEGDDVISFGRKINGPTGTLGDIDAETHYAILEAKGGQTWDLKATDQMYKLQGPAMNPSGKPVIVYAPNMPGDKIAGIEATGVYVAQNETQLIELLNLLR